MSSRVSKSGRQLLRRALACGFDPQLSKWGPRAFLNARREKARARRKGFNVL